MVPNDQKNLTFFISTENLLALETFVHNY